MSRHKRYIGDGVYIDFDGYTLWLTAEDGIRATNTIALEPAVYEALVRFADQILKEKGGDPP